MFDLLIFMYVISWFEYVCVYIYRYSILIVWKWIFSDYLSSLGMVWYRGIESCDNWDRICIYIYSIYMLLIVLYKECIVVQPLVPLVMTETARVHGRSFWQRCAQHIPHGPIFKWPYCCFEIFAYCVSWGSDILTTNLP